ncbi:hypothetical protein [Microbulbifer litoralis]|uniref:hypothetical protein n=1 Tax=Microbulbifer litoralis TaxID=2933965 RepID=UPI002029470C|nr:hypothetical protein [Microbulbifer sp. GX H0434]
MTTSTLDHSISIDDSFGAISVIVTSTGQAGHSLIAVEYMVDGIYQNVVADLVPLPHSAYEGRAPQKNLIKGSAGNHPLKTKVRILGNDSGTSNIVDKVGRPFNSKSWRRPVEVLNEALALIGFDASASTQNPGYDAYQNSPYRYQFFGQPSSGTPDSWGASHGVNCGNWARKVLESAEVMDRAGFFLDIPRFQSYPGWREWAFNFMAAMGLMKARL